MEKRVGRAKLLDFARELGVGRTTVFRWIREGINGIRLRCTHVGTRVFISWEDYHEWQASLRPTPVEPRRKTSKATWDALKRMGYLK